MDFTVLGYAAQPGGCADDSSNHSASETCTLPAYLRAPEVTAQVMAEYIWLVGGTGQLRSKTKVLESKPCCPEEAPIMVVESNPGNQLAEPNHELFLKPRKIFRDPFRGGDHILVLCDTFYAAQVAADLASGPATVLQPSESNSRVACENVLKVAEQEELVFAVEQEYAIIHPAYPTVVPLGPRRSSSRNSSTSGSRGDSHSGSIARGGVSKVGLAKSSHTVAAPGARRPHSEGGQRTSANGQGASRQKSARTVADSHLRCCLYAGVKVTGADVHSLEGLHSFKIGPSSGVNIGDDLWTSRYLLQRVAEDLGTTVSWDPDALPQERPLGCYFKYSTAATRQTPRGLGVMEQQLARLQATHIQHQFAYNDGKLERLASPSVSTFTHAVGSANASVVVPSLSYLQQGGYYVDRRPPSDVDPYKVTLLLAATTLDIPLPKLPATSSGCCTAPSAGRATSPIRAMAACPQGLAYSPMSSFLMAIRQQQHCMYDSESEECDSVDESNMTEDSAALLAKMDEDGRAGTASCESDFEQDDASSGPMADWDEETSSHLLGDGL